MTTLYAPFSALCFTGPYAPCPICARQMQGLKLHLLVRDFYRV